MKAIRWATKEETFRMIDEGTFLPYYPGLIWLVFEMEDRYGVPFPWEVW